MLRWRLILGVLIISLLTALCRADLQASRPGLWLVPLAIVLSVFAAQEILRLLRLSGQTPAAWTVYAGSLITVISACAPIAWKDYPADCPVGRLGWLACGIAAALLLAIVGEMRRYAAPGNAFANLSAVAFSIIYVGGLLGFLVQLRLLPVGGEVGNSGMLALLSMIIVVKATDVGAYAVGRICGSHKMAPVLSPGKTWEGLGGGLVFAIAGATIAFGPLANTLEVDVDRSGLRWIALPVVYGLVVGVAGVIGDLAESLLKRDAGVKDSSQWLPGFGGVLDLMDSLLVAAPVAYFCWLSGLIV